MISTYSNRNHQSRRDAMVRKVRKPTFKIPVVPANMESAINDDLAVWLQKRLLPCIFVLNQREFPLSDDAKRAFLFLFQSVLR